MAAPKFKGTAVIKGQFKEISLDDYKGKYVVLFFYPLDFTFVCPTEIIAFNDRAGEFEAINTAVIACSTDSQFSHLAWCERERKQGGLGSMQIPLLADKNMAISRAYGVLKEDDGVPFRGLFIIDPKGTLRQITINDLPVGRDVDETLRLVQAFQFTDEHGEVRTVLQYTKVDSNTENSVSLAPQISHEIFPSCKMNLTQVCPAGWKPGAPTMKPDPKGSQDYFSKSN